ncbi:Os10g0470300 [Oryza sativa Japonica Group]|uniref:Os10g0470300 protein n=1 Tax=Oryza sativa subsp. japonica TaxID=39947 RepID=A0A0P0XV70_ORYSJ|nr:Os10g0470300 [Oryza sativa Japonica Group]
MVASGVGAASGRARGEESMRGAEAGSPRDFVGVHTSAADVPPPSPMLCSSCMEIPSRLRGGGQVRWASMPAGRATPSSSCSSPSSEARAAARHQAENEHGCGLAEMKAAAAGALVEKARENHLCTTGQ